MQKLKRAVFAGALCVAAGACTTAISGSADNISRLEQERASDPKSESVLRTLGIAYFKANRYDDARNALRQATAADPKDGVAALYLGLTAEAQNDLPAARSAYEEYIAVGKTRGVKNQINARLAVIARKENEEAAKQAIAQERQLSTTPGPTTTVAVMQFRFTGSDTSLKPLERGMADLVTTDLSHASALKVVERTRLQALLDEIQLQQNVGVEAGTGVRAGKILQAGSLVGGSISQLGTNQLSASSNVTNVQTSAAIGSGFTGQTSLDDFFTLEKNIVLKVIEDLGVRLQTAERIAIDERPTRSMIAFLSYSRGLELEDRGRFDDASREFDNAIRADPGFTGAQQKSQEAKNLSAGGSVTAGTVESGLRGTVEGAAAAGGSTNTGSSAAAVAEGLNPSIAGNASAGGGTGAGQPTKDASAGTGGDNPTTKTAKVTLVIKAPKP